MMILPHSFCHSDKSPSELPRRRRKLLASRSDLIEKSGSPAQRGGRWPALTVATIATAISEVANLHRAKGGLK